MFPRSLSVKTLETVRNSLYLGYLEYHNAFYIIWKKKWSSTFLNSKKKKKVSAKRLFINIIRHSLFLDLLSYDDLFPSINHLGKNILRFKETETEKQNIFCSKKKKKKKSISFFLNSKFYALSFDSVDVITNHNFFHSSFLNLIFVLVL